MRSALSVHFEIFQVGRLNFQNFLVTTKLLIKEFKDNQMTVFGVVNKVLHLNGTVVPQMIMTGDFNNQKVANI